MNQNQVPPGEGAAGGEPAALLKGPDSGVRAKKRRAGSFFMRMLKGAVIGVAAMLPGASGGVLALSMGIYHGVINAVTGFFKAVKKNVIYLLPLGIGCVVGLLATSRVVEYLLSHYKAPVMFTLIGMVLGGVPSLIQDANRFGFKKRYLFGTLFGLVVIGLFGLLERMLMGAGQWPLNIWTAMLSGGILAVGTVIPGISTSFILMFMGLYEPLLAAFNRFDILTLLFLGIGALAVAALLILFVKRMFDRHRGYTYYASLGFLTGSIALIFPEVRWELGLLVNFALFLAGFVGTYLICKYTDQYKEE